MHGEAPAAQLGEELEDIAVVEAEFLRQLYDLGHDMRQVVTEPAVVQEDGTTNLSAIDSVNDVGVSQLGGLLEEGTEFRCHLVAVAGPHRRRRA